MWHIYRFVDLREALDRLAIIFGKETEYITYSVYGTHKKRDFWYVDHSDKGWVVKENRVDGSGVYLPFGSKRRHPQVFCRWVEGMIDNAKPVKVSADVVGRFPWVRV